MTKQIDRSTYLQALALFTVADARNKECETFHEALANLLGVDLYGHIGDAVFSGEDGTIEDRFNEALGLEGIAFTLEANHKDTPHG